MQFPHMKLPTPFCGPKAHDDEAAAKTVNNDDERTTTSKSSDGVTNAMAETSLDGTVDEASLPNEDTAPILAILMEELSKEDGHEVATALHKLSNFTHNGKAKNAIDNHKVIFQNGGHLAILQAMKRFIDKPEVQVFGLGTLMNLSSDRTGQNRMLIAQIGGIETIIKSMNANPADSAVQRRGCGAFANLIQENEAHGVRLDQAGGITSIVVAMTAFPDDPRVQFYALRTLDSLSQWEECEAHMLAAKGASAVAAALENHGADKEVSHMARKLFGHFAASKVIAAPVGPIEP